MDFFEIMLQQKLAGGGGDVKVNSLSVTENGTYTASTGYAFSPINVSVPVGVFPSGTSDITSNGIYSVVDFASVNVNVQGIIPSGTSSITANGIYDITSFASVDVNVSGGGGGGITADDVAMRTISGAISGSATSIGSSTFTNCTALTTASFPNATSIGDRAFQYCSALTTANFPNVTSIGSYAFANCSRLTTAIFLASSVALLSNSSAFQSTPMSRSTYTGSFGSIYVPASLVDSYKTATNWSAYADRITSYEGE